jgi:hypothetical protein
MAQQPPAKVAFVSSGDKPLVLAGPPRGVRGEVHLLNPSDEKVIIRKPLMRSMTPPARGKAAKASARTAALLEEPLALRRIIVRPGQTRLVPIVLNLNATTPPGTYQAELDVDGVLREVLVHVTEDVSFSIEPRDLVIPNRPGQKIQKQIVVTNTGNVPVVVKTIGALVLDEELAHCRALRGALADVGATLKNLDDFVVALGHRYHDIYDKLILKVQNDSTTVDPGETEAIDLTITQPDKLDTRARYSTYAPISTDSLNFTIVPE